MYDSISTGPVDVRPYCCLRAGHMEKDQEYDGALESLDERFEKHGSQGSVGNSGGCTDASVRLSTLLKVTKPW